MTDECAVKIVKASNNRYSVDEAKELLTTVERNLQKQLADGTLMDIDYSVLNEVETAAAKRLERIAAEKRYTKFRDAVLVRRSVNELLDIPGKPEDAVNFFASSLENAMNTHEARLHGQLTKSLRDKGVLDAFQQKYDPDNVAKYKGQLTVLDEAKKPSINSIPPGEKIAYRIAEALVEVEQDMLKRLRGLGAPINFLEGRQGKNTWNPMMIEANKEGFISKMHEVLDWDKMYLGELTKEQFLNNLTESFISGVHDPSYADLNYYETLLGTDVKARVGASLADRLGKSRKLHIKPEYWHQIQKEFGYGDIYDLTKRDLLDSGRSLAYLERLGSNPEASWQTIMRKYKAKTKSAGSGGKHPVDELGDRLWFHLSGRADNAANYLGARLSSSVRNFMSALHLGGVVTTSLVDPVHAATRSASLALSKTVGEEVMQYGSALASEYGKVVGLYGDEVAKSIFTAAKEELEDLSAMMARDMRFADVFTSNNLHGTYNGGKRYKALNAIDAAHNQLFKFNFIEEWTRNRFANTYVGTASQLGDFAGKSFDELPSVMQDWLSELQVKEVWDLARRKTTQGATGKTYLTPQALDDLTIQDVKLASAVEITDREATNLLNEYKNRWRSAFLQEAKVRVITPDISTRAAMFGTTQRGTSQGELLRMIFQFKSFPIALFQKLVFPTIKRGKWGVIGSSMLATAGINMMITWISDITSGKTPRPYSGDDEAAVATNWTSLIFRSAGFPYADEILPRMFIDKGGSAGDYVSLLGPAAGDTVKTIINTSQAAAALAEGDFEKAGAKTLPSLYNAPVIGPLLHGHILGRTMKNVLYGSLQEALTGDYDDVMNDFAEKQGSRYYNLVKDGGQFVEDLTGK